MPERHSWDYGGGLSSEITLACSTELLLFGVLSSEVRCSWNPRSKGWSCPSRFPLLSFPEAVARKSLVCTEVDSGQSWVASSNCCQAPRRHLELTPATSRKGIHAATHPREMVQAQLSDFSRQMTAGRIKYDDTVCAPDRPCFKILYSLSGERGVPLAHPLYDWSVSQADQNGT